MSTIGLGSHPGTDGRDFNLLQEAFRTLGASRQFHQTASELAFHRSRIARGMASSDAQEREAAYQMALRDLIQRLR